MTEHTSWSHLPSVPRDWTARADRAFSLDDWTDADDLDSGDIAEALSAASLVEGGSVLRVVAPDGAVSGILRPLTGDFIRALRFGVRREGTSFDAESEWTAGVVVVDGANLAAGHYGCVLQTSSTAYSTAVQVHTASAWDTVGSLEIELNYHAMVLDVLVQRATNTLKFWYARPGDTWQLMRAAGNTLSASTVQLGLRIDASGAGHALAIDLLAYRSFTALPI